MSVVDLREVQVDLPRTGCGPFWDKLIEDAGDDPLRWKYLAMLALRENAGWPLSAIGAVFGHPKGHVSRALKNFKERLAEEYSLEDAA